MNTRRSVHLLLLLLLLASCLLYLVPGGLLAGGLSYLREAWAASRNSAWPDSSNTTGNTTQGLVANRRDTDDKLWWENRFSEEEKRNMSVLARVVFTGEAPPPSSNSSFTILMWKYGTLTERRYLRAYTDTFRDPWQGCSVRNCKIEYDERRILAADAVVFHLHKLQRSDLSSVLALPRRPQQRWVWLTDESPHHTNLFLDKLRTGVFNWSMTYHSHSDVPVPYGRVVQGGEQEHGQGQGQGKEQGQEQEQEQEQSRNYHGEKERSVAMLASNCGGSSGRFRYLDRLVKSLQVLYRYMFYLAFENSACSEYITEKLWWNSYAKLSVPIVLGGLSSADYSRLLPPNSFLHVDNFSSPEQLAEKVKFLMKHPAEYNRYHSWRSKYTVMNEHGFFGAPIRHYCRLCQALNYNNREPKVFSDLEVSWSQTNHCRQQRW